ncbi:MAG: hypothetical protein ABIB79_00850 [archaeon]
MKIEVEYFLEYIVKEKIEKLDKKLGTLVGLGAEKSFRDFLFSYVRGIKIDEVKNRVIDQLYDWGSHCIGLFDSPYYERRGVDCIVVAMKTGMDKN